jgi:asparagine synthase (glutamine-hydrolysing)
MNGYQKMILRQSAKGILNDKVRLDRRKKGFNASINSIVNFKDAKIKNYFFDKKSKINEYIDMKKIYEITENENIDNYLSKFLFSVLNTKTFLDLFD